MCKCMYNINISTVSSVSVEVVNKIELQKNIYIDDQTAGMYLGNDRIGELVPYFFRTLAFRYFIR